MALDLHTDFNPRYGSLSLDMELFCDGIYDEATGPQCGRKWAESRDKLAYIAPHDLSTAHLPPGVLSFFGFDDEDNVEDDEDTWASVQARDKYDELADRYFGTNHFESLELRTFDDIYLSTYGMDDAFWHETDPWLLDDQEFDEHGLPEVEEIQEETDSDYCFDEVDVPEALDESDLGLDFLPKVEGLRKGVQLHDFPRRTERFCQKRNRGQKITKWWSALCAERHAAKMFVRQHPAGDNFVTA